MALSRRLVDLLVAGGLLPPSTPAPDLAGARGLAEALHVLRDAWQTRRDRAAAPRVRAQAEPIIRALAGWLDDGAEASAIPGRRIGPLAGEWLGPRVCWWTHGILPGRRVALASSRLPRQIDPRGAWLRALRAALDRCAAGNDLIITAETTAGARLVRRGTAIRGLRCLPIVGTSAGQSPRAWMQRLMARAAADPRPSAPELWLAPVELRTGSGIAKPPAPIDLVPEADRAVIALADEVIVLHLRPGGNLHTLLRARLAGSPVARGAVWIANPPELVSPALRDELRALGAAPWDLPVHDSGIVVAPPAPDVVRAAAPIVPVPSPAGWEFLIHATRACPGPWPEQAEDDYLDRLIEGHPDAGHSAAATLRRIITSRRLIGSSTTIRGGSRMVSFTMVPLAELPRLRVFRRHRGRWDFEPFGICIHRPWLEARGARPVCYGTEALWTSLAECDRPFFQLVRRCPSDQPGSAAADGIDWSQEQEWRFPGDLSLNDLPAGSALVFVADETEARRIAGISPWPVAVL